MLMSSSLRYVHLSMQLNRTKNNLQPLDSNEWNVFKSKGLHMIHLNINSLLPKIDQLRYTANSSNAAVIGLSESKLD